MSPESTAPEALPGVTDSWGGFYEGSRHATTRRPRSVAVRLSDSWLCGWLLAAWDVALWIGSFAAVNFLRELLHVQSHLPNLGVVLLPLAVILVVSAMVGAYDRRTDFLSLDFSAQYSLALGLAAAVAVGLVAVVSTYGIGTQPSRLMVPLTLLLFLGPALVARRICGRRRLAVHGSKPVLILGQGSEVHELAAALASGDLAARSHVAMDPVTFEELCPPLGLTGHAAQPETSYRAVVLAADPDALSPHLLHRLVDAHFTDTPVLTVESFFESHLRRVYLPKLRPHWLFEREFVLAGRSTSHAVKRVADLLLCSVALVLLAPVLLLVALAIRLESPGPAIFRQPRVGRHGTVFTLFKFRTMKVHHSGPKYTATGDSRITRLGNFLRRSRLDEIPQLWNVLRGEMSLIGPRAEWTACAEDYERTIPNYHLRHLVRPGITGWAQVNYPYGASREDAIEKLRYDLFYIKHFSISLDWSILLKTIHVMLFARGGR